MTDIATLRADIRLWLTRPSITDGEIATGLRLLEAELARDFRPRSTEKTISLTISSSPFDLRTAGPGGTDLRVQKIRALSNNDQLFGSNELTELAPSQIEFLDFSRIIDLAGYFALVGDTLVVEPAPSVESPASFTMCYFERPAALSDANPTSPTIQEFYDLYLFGALKHIAQLLQDTSRTQQFAQQFATALEMARKSENRARWTANPQTAFRRIIEVP